MKRNVLVVLFVYMLGLAALWLAVGRSTPVNAQSNIERWNSSAEAPDGTPPESYAPVDNPTLINQEDIIEAGGLISWRVTGSALKPRDSNVSYSTNSAGDGGCVYVTGGSAFTVWNTPINLPNGSVVNTLRMYYYDTDASNTIAWFTIYDLYGSIVDEYSVSSNTNAGNSFNDSDPINQTIDYSVYNYVLNWRPVVTGSTVQLCGFRIFYTPPPYGLGFIPAMLTP